jgi:hypothetical protein
LKVVVRRKADVVTKNNHAWIVTAIFFEMPMENE